MNQQSAEKAVTISALIVAGVYIYRRLTEGTGPATGSKLAQLAGQGSPPPAGVFITAWGITYLVISILASASPGFGGSFAILVATGDLLSNTQQVANDINQKVKPPPAKPAAGHPTKAAASAPHPQVSPLTGQFGGGTF